MISMGMLHQDTNTSLQSILKTLKIPHEKEQAHTAGHDALCTVRLLAHLLHIETKYWNHMRGIVHEGTAP